MSKESSCRANIGTIERVLSVVGGVSIFLFARRRGEWWSLPLGLSGGMLLERGISGYCPAYQALGIDRNLAEERPGDLPATRRPPPRDPVTEASEDSFPASDAPSWPSL